MSRAMLGHKERGRETERAIVRDGEVGSDIQSERRTERERLRRHLVVPLTVCINVITWEDKLNYKIFTSLHISKDSWCNKGLSDSLSSLLFSLLLVDFLSLMVN